MANEVAVESPACALAERHGWVSRKLKYIGRRAGPDRLFYGHGRVVLVEFKDPDEGELSGLQRNEWARLEEAGVKGKHAFIVDNMRDFARIMDLPWPG